MAGSCRPPVPADRIAGADFRSRNSRIGGSGTCGSDYVGAGDKAVLLKAHVRQHARNFTKLLPGAGADGERRSEDWRMFVNANVETDA